MKNGRRIVNDHLKKRVQDSLRKNQDQNKRHIIKNGTSRKTFLNKAHLSLPNINLTFDRKKDDKNLYTIPSKITKLELPEKGSFNAGIIDLGNKILCVYRPNEQEFIACFLDYEFKVIENYYHKFNMYGVTDPRLVKTPDNKILMSYSKTFNKCLSETIAGCVIMDLNISDKNIFHGKEIRICPEEVKGRQKNWMPFVYENKIYFISNVCPHEIYEVYTESIIKSQKKYITTFKNNWFLKHGLRGNTNAVLLPDGNYLATFHTVSKDRNLQYYDNGFYMFEGKPPFRVTHMSEKTYLKAEDAVEPHFRKAGLILCAFPVGMILKENKIYISYGDNDSCVKILETSLDDIMKIMVKIENE